MSKILLMAFAIVLAFSSFSLNDAKAQMSTRDLDSMLYNQHKSVAAKLYPEANTIKASPFPREKTGKWHSHHVY